MIKSLPRPWNLTKGRSAGGLRSEEEGEAESLGARTLMVASTRGVSLRRGFGASNGDALKGKAAMRPEAAAVASISESKARESQRN